MLALILRLRAAKRVNAALMTLLMTWANHSWLKAQKKTKQLELPLPLTN